MNPFSLVLASNTLPLNSQLINYDAPIHSLSTCMSNHYVLVGTAVSGVWGRKRSKMQPLLLGTESLLQEVRQDIICVKN